MIEFVSSLSRNLAAALRASDVPRFNLRFAQLQNTVIRRLNEKIQDISESDQINRRQSALIDDSKTFRDSLDKVDDYILRNEANSQFLLTALATATTLLGAISSDDDDTNVTSNEIFQFESVRNKLATEIDKLHFVVIPELLRPDLIFEIIALGQELQSKNLVEGTVDAENTVNTTNKNRPIQDFVQFLHDKINIAITVTNNAVVSAKRIRLRLFGDVAENQADRIALVKSETKRKELEVEKEKERAATLLSAISLSFEIRLIQTQTLNASLLEGRKLDPGSILNIFL